MCVLTLAVVCAQCVQKVYGGAAQELLPQGVAAPQLQIQTTLRRHITVKHKETRTHTLLPAQTRTDTCI